MAKHNLQKRVEIRSPPSDFKSKVGHIFDFFASKGIAKLKMMMNLQKTINCLFYMQSRILKHIRSVKYSGLAESKFKWYWQKKPKSNWQKKKPYHPRLIIEYEPWIFKYMSVKLFIFSSLFPNICLRLTLTHQLTNTSPMQGCTDHFAYTLLHWFILE